MLRAAASLALALTTAACRGESPEGAATGDLPLLPGYWEIASDADPARPLRSLSCLEDAQHLSLEALVSQVGAQTCGQERADDLRKSRPECLKNAVKLTRDATLRRSRTSFVLDVRTQLWTVPGTPQERRVTARGRWVGACPVAAS